MLSWLAAGWPERTGWRLEWALRSLRLLPWGCCRIPDRPRAKIRGTQLSETKDRPFSWGEGGKMKEPPLH